MMASFFVTLNIVSNSTQPSFPLNPAERSPRLLLSPLALFNSSDTQTSVLHTYLSFCSPSGECPTWVHHPGPGCYTVPVVPYSSKTTQSPKYPSPSPLTLPVPLPSWDHVTACLHFRLCWEQTGNGLCPALFQAIALGSYFQL